MKIEEGMYVRTKEGYIVKCTYKEDTYEDGIVYGFDNHICLAYGGEKLNGGTWELINEIVVTASHNIIDLIEIGDYINGVQVIDFETDNLTEKYIQCGVGDYVTNTYYNKEIETIVTKEMMKSMEYRIGD